MEHRDSLEFPLHDPVGGIWAKLPSGEPDQAVNPSHQSATSYEVTPLLWTYDMRAQGEIDRGSHESLESLLPGARDVHDAPELTGALSQAGGLENIIHGTDAREYDHVIDDRLWDDMAETPHETPIDAGFPMDNYTEDEFDLEGKLDHESLDHEQLDDGDVPGFHGRLFQM